MTQNELPPFPWHSDKVRAMLPHRYPFLLVDRVTDAVVGESLSALKNVTHNEPFFHGHFPSQPIMPGVLMVEALAQAAGILAFISMSHTMEADDITLLVGIDKARFKRMVVPGDQLELKVELIKLKQDIARFKGQAFVDGVLACSVELLSAKKR